MGDAVVVIGDVLIHGTAYGFECREREYEEPPMFERAE